MIRLDRGEVDEKVALPSLCSYGIGCWYRDAIGGVSFCRPLDRYDSSTRAADTDSCSRSGTNDWWCAESCCASYTNAKYWTAASTGYSAGSCRECASSHTGTTASTTTGPGGVASCCSGASTRRGTTTGTAASTSTGESA